MPVTTPFRIWPRRGGGRPFNLYILCTRAALVAGLSRMFGLTPLEAPDVLALVELARLRRVPGGDDVGEVHRVLHLPLGLAAHEEVGAEGLVGAGVHPHGADQVVGLHPL